MDETNEMKNIIKKFFKNQKLILTQFKFFFEYIYTVLSNNLHRLRCAKIWCEFFFFRYLSVFEAMQKPSSRKDNYSWSILKILVINLIYILFKSLFCDVNRIRIIYFLNEVKNDFENIISYCSQKWPYHVSI